VTGEPARGETATGEEPPVRVEEVELQLEAHAEAVDGVTPRKQQPRPDALASQAREPEQAGAETESHGNLDPERMAARQPAQASGFHRRSRPKRTSFRPTPADPFQCNPTFSAHREQARG
jgi:hypothetical protein